MTRFPTNGAVARRVRVDCNSELELVSERFFSVVECVSDLNEHFVAYGYEGHKRKLSITYAALTMSILSEYQIVS